MCSSSPSDLCEAQVALPFGLNFNFDPWASKLLAKFGGPGKLEMRILEKGKGRLTIPVEESRQDVGVKQFQPPRWLTSEVLSDQLHHFSY